MNRKLRTTMIALALTGGLAACDSGPADNATAPSNTETARNTTPAAPDNSATAPGGAGSMTEPNQTAQGMS
ncbi:MAG: hypothetical protein ACREQV_09020, partial [Candidatus Binatia bacterium]